MSNYLTGLSQLNPQVKRHNGGTATLTLDKNGTTNATLLFVNGVAQTPGIDFNVSGATLTTTSTLPAGTNIATTIQYFNTGIVNTVADDSIGLAQMASGVDGNIISYDASGNPVAVATGNDGQVLTSSGAGSPPAFETPAGGGAWTLISSTVASDSSTVTITGLSTAYQVFAIALDNMDAASTNNTLFMRIGNSSGIVSTGSNYDSHVQTQTENGTSYLSQNLASSNNGFQIGPASGFDTDYGINAVLFLQRNSSRGEGDSRNNPYMHGTYSCHSSATGDMCGGVAVYRYANAELTDMDRIEVRAVSGNLAKGRVTVWGIADS